MSTLLTPPVSAGRSSGQRAFDELEDPLREVTFVVVDLETTGGSSKTEEITEIGAVKVRGGELLGEFATLVDPGRSIPPQITMLTGISDSMVFDAPRINEVLPGFLEFIRGCVLVAHNAPFDVGFLKAACIKHEMRWPAPPIVDTVRLARRVLTREEAPSVRLGLLAPLLGARVAPDHRALTDARATVDVLHALLERVGPLGVQSLSELTEVVKDLSPARRRKRHLADRLPQAPGVYLFRGPEDQVLYVGTATDLRRRVRSYFSAAESRARIKQMVGLAVRVDHVVCAHPLEANIRELRLIAAHRPPYNRASKTPNKVVWITLTQEAYPRLSIVNTARKPGVSYLGPFRSRRQAQEALDGLSSVLKLRRCTIRIRRNNPDGSPCALAELGHCGAPCAGLESVETYERHGALFRTTVDGSDPLVLQKLYAKMENLSSQERFAEAAMHRDRLKALVGALHRRQRIGAFAEVAEMVVARADGHGGWELVVIRHGRLAAAARARQGVDPLPLIEMLIAAAETVIPVAGPLPAASAEETSTILRWIETGTRLVQISNEWSSPLFGAGRWQRLQDLQDLRDVGQSDAG
ncbi:DEDD exonuclease domain-containing protein [Nakamurella antarctica]|uniref:DEDD exonuclease domain-containing protein n=1 Tax=Nakamurella antarctica TaxID=1902245 RepID=UPI001EF0B662|nr:DEDD exonuclease domain-containing protein [Nakamurella antarctica]